MRGAGGIGRKSAFQSCLGDQGTELNVDISVGDGGVQVVAGRPFFASAQGVYSILPPIEIRSIRIHPGPDAYHDFGMGPLLLSGQGDELR